MASLALRQVLAAAIALAAGAPACAQGGSDPVTARIAVIYRDEQPTAIMWRRFAELARERSGGTLRLEIFTGGQLGGEREVAEAMRIGAVQGADSTLAALSSWVPEGQIFDLPFLFRDLDHVESVMTGPIGARYAALYRERGFVALAFIAYGARHLVSRAPIAAPADLRGRRMRVLQSPLHIAIWSALGANPTPIPITEAYPALQSGVVDLMDMTKDGYEALKLYEVAPYFVETGHVWSIGALVFGAAFWQRLDPARRAVLEDGAREMAAYFNRLQQREIAVALDRAAARGARVNVPDPAPWRAALEAFRAAEAERMGVTETVRAILATR